MYLYGEMFSLIFKMHCTVLNNQISRIKEMNIFNDSKDMIRTLSHTAWWEWPLAQSLQKSSWQYLSRTLKIFRPKDRNHKRALPKVIMKILRVDKVA